MNRLTDSSIVRSVQLYLMGVALATPLCADAPAGRVSEGLLVLYDFASTEGDVVAERSGVGEPLDLEIEDLETVQRSPGRLGVLGSAIVKSPGRADKIANTVRITEEITLETWFRADEAGSKAPATLMAIAPKSDQLDFVLSQQGDRFDMRFRTTRTGTTGLPAMRFEAEGADGALTHLVYTRDRTGRARVFVNGRKVTETTETGSMAGWERFPFVLANELDGKSPWRGELYLVAVYARDLLAEEVAQNFEAGHDYRAAELSSLEDPEGGLFEAKVAPLFARKCLQCHDAAVKSGGLDLSQEQSLLAGGVNGSVLTPGDAANSRLIELIETEKMPLGRPPLLKSEKAMLRKWVDSGAAWTLAKIDPAVHAKREKKSETWVQRLTVPEYVETVRSSLGVDVSEEAAEILPPDNSADGFKNTAYNLTVDLGHVEAYARLARAIVDRMDVGAFARKHSSSRSLAEADLERLISSMAGEILRSPVEEDELSLFKGLAASVVSAGGNFEEVVGYVLESMLQSPRFLYRVENQRGDGQAWPAGEHELASRMSYILWGAPPDRELKAAAAAGSLHDPAVFDEQIRRMLADERTVERSEQFLSEWLDLERLENLQPNREKFPEWDPEVAADMRAETLAYFRDVVWEQKRPLTDLLNAQLTYATPRLAKHYGLQPKGEGLQRYDLSSTPSRGGLLTQGSVLTIGGDEASMVTRGLFVLEELLFGEVGSPPPGLDTTPPPTSPGRSNRAISTERVESAACGGCHAKFEPLAFGLERFDGLGAYRETDRHGNALREDGEVLIPGEAKATPYNTAAQMMDLLAESERVEMSLTRKAAQFALGRPLIGEDEPELAAIHKRARRQGFTYASLIAAIVKSDLVRRTRTEALPLIGR